MGDDGHARLTRIEPTGTGPMIARACAGRSRNRFLVLLGAVMVAAWGILSGGTNAARCAPGSVRRPGHHPDDLSGQAPQIARIRSLSAHEDDAVRARCEGRARFSFFGDSFVYVLFEDGHRSLLGAARACSSSEPGAVAAAGRRAKPRSVRTRPGVGWVYEYALIDRTGQHDLSSCAPSKTGS